MQKKIVLSIADGMVERNLLKTDFLDLLQHAFEEVVILSSVEDFFRYLQGRYSSNKIRIAYFPYRVRKIDALFNYIFRNSISTYTVQEEQYNALKGINGRKKIIWPLFLFYRICWYLGKFSWWRRWLRFWYRILTFDRYAYSFLKSEQPSIVFAPSITLADYKLVQTAKELGLVTVQMIKSWDNLTSKTFLGCLPDYLITHNEVIKKEAITLDDMPGERIFVSGIPQFDYLLKHQHLLFQERREFYEGLEIDPKKSVILFSVTGGALNPYEKDFLKMLNKAIEEGALPEDTHIHVRLHPKNESDMVGVEAFKHVTIEKPFTYLENSRSWIFEEKDIAHWYNSLIHSQLVINTASTMAIDAAYFDKPVICLAFDGYQSVPKEKSISRFYRRNHYKNIVDAGAVDIVFNETEFISAVRTALSNPRRKKEEREKMVRQQCYKVDRKASERIVNFLISHAK